jgi:hypothetical protein
MNETDRAWEKRAKAAEASLGTLLEKNAELERAHRSLALILRPGEPVIVATKVGIQIHHVPPEISDRTWDTKKQMCKAIVAFFMRIDQVKSGTKEAV